VVSIAFTSWLIAEAAGLGCSVLSHGGNWLIKSRVLKEFQCGTAVLPDFVCREWWSILLRPGEKQSLLVCLVDEACSWASACTCEGEKCF